VDVQSPLAVVVLADTHDTAPHHDGVHHARLAAAVGHRAVASVDGNGPRANDLVDTLHLPRHRDRELLAAHDVQTGVANEGLNKSELSVLHVAAVDGHATQAHTPATTPQDALLERGEFNFVQ
jgi:hypothetical protein